MNFSYRLQTVFLISVVCMAGVAPVAQAAATSTVRTSNVGSSELTKEIAAQQVRIQQLTKARASASGIARTLRRGASGKDVRLLQDFLKLYGAFSTTSTSTGYFGAQTARAVKTFQSKESLMSIGVVGPKTRERIRALSANEIVQEKSRVASSSVVATASIADVVFSGDVGEDGSGVGSSTVFASTTANIYAIVTLAQAQQDTMIGFVRYYNGAYVDSGVTHPNRSRLRYLHIQWALKTGMNRTPGTYTVVWYVDGVRSKTTTFTVI